MIFNGKKVEDIGCMLFDARQDLDWTRYDLANKSGISLNMCYRMENNITKSPSLVTVEALLDTLGYELVIRKKGK